MSAIIFLLKNWKYVLLISFSIVIYFLISANNKQESELNRKTQNIEVLNGNFSSYKAAFNTGLKTSRGKDSIILLNAAKVQALAYTVDEFKHFRAVDVQTIKELNLKLKNVQSVTNIGISTTSTITTSIVYVDSTKCLHYKDEFTSVDGCFTGKTIQLTVQNRDSLTTVVSRIPKHRFLWWSWGTKAIQLDIRSQNPNTKFSYLKYIELK
ncbi:MAG: DUF6549 family protein [Paludibacter sp.]